MSIDNSFVPCYAKFNQYPRFAKGERKEEYFMRAIMVMFDSLNRRFLSPYGCDFTHTPNFKRLSELTVQFQNCYSGSLPCMPARRELHTGRYNFLHRNWGPIEPYDDSMPEILKNNGIYTHLVSDHGHYWEDGGATYHNRYSTWENVRGQEGDHWKGVVNGVEDTDPNLIQFDGFRKNLYNQDLVNRSYMKEEKNHPQVKTFDAGLEFIETNTDADNWFLQIECFDPHEPFFSYQKYKDLYPHEYDGGRFDWPDYAPVNQSPEQVEHARFAYLALLSMCDAQLGRVLDMMDKHDMWKDTMLIVNTDHGYMLGEHSYWAKNYMPMYDEVVHIPLFIWDPRSGKRNEKRESLVQTIDLPATLLDYFGIPLTKDMEGVPLKDTIEKDTPVRDYALFGMFGAHICCTDGQYVLMKAPVSEDGSPLYEYGLMPTHMARFFSKEELDSLTLAGPFSFTKGYRVMRTIGDCTSDSYHAGDLLFNLKTDPEQNYPLQDKGLKAKLEREMVSLMKKNDAPEEQYERVGLSKK